jgi:uncharacterized protein (TIRG00374 family)
MADQLGRPDSAPGPGPGAEAGRPERSALRRAWPALRLVVGLAAVGVAAWVVSGKTQELTGISGYLNHLRWWWMIVAVFAELLSYAALSQLQRRLLRAGRVRVPAASIMRITVAASAIQYSFPGGSVIYLAYLFRQFRRWGADDLLAGWVIVAFNMVTFAALAVISAVGLALALGVGSTYNLVEVILGIAAMSIIFAILVLERRRLLPHLTRLVGVSQRVLRRPRPDLPPAELIRLWASELSAVSPSRLAWMRAGVLGLANWLADLSCLALSFFAVGVGVPWRGLLLAYGAGQLASILPITPGGLGAVEGSITVALVTFGGGAESTVAAVLLYRMVSFWMMLPIGWVSWGTIAWGTRRRLPREDPVAALGSGG